MDKPHTIEDLIMLCSTYLNEDNIKLIVKSYEVAKSYHEGQYRKSGDPYIQHPLEVAYILGTINAGPNTICAGLLHDVLEDTEMTKEEMTLEFNEEIAEIVRIIEQCKCSEQYSNIKERYDKSFNPLGGPVMCREGM